MRVGLGYDIHRVEAGRPMVLGGFTVADMSAGLKGHSDGDVLIHAVCDALLGAAGEDDLGSRYPDTDPAYKGADSRVFLRETAAVIKEKGFRIGNIDCVVICEEPKISRIKKDIVEAIEKILDLPRGTVNVKGKTAELVGEIGAGKAVAAYAVVLLEEE